MTQLHEPAFVIFALTARWSDARAAM